MENNKFFLSGEIVRAPYINDNKKYGSVTIKVYSEGRLEYLSFICFRNVVEVLSTFSAGDKVSAVCRLHSHSYEKGGKKIYSQDIIADSISLLSD